MSNSSGTSRPSGSHPIGTERKKRPWWLLLLIAAVAIVVLLLLLTQCGGDDTSTDGTTAASPSPSTSPTSAAATASESPTPTASASPTGTATTSQSATPSESTSPSAATETGGTGTLTAGPTSLLPLAAAAPDGSLATYVGQPATAAGVMVLSVPADEGFWVGTSDTDRVWVQIVGNGESPYRVKTGDVVDFTGSVVTHAKKFADRVGVDEAEGAQLLGQQRAHIAADRSTLMLSAG